MSRNVTLFRAAALTLGFGFLYLPIALLVAYSFNASRLVAVWGGWSLHWYGALIDDDKFRDAALNSLKIGVMAASLALVLGTCAGFAIARFTRFHGRFVFSFMLMAPLVVPEVILGLSLLLLFVASQAWLGWPASRGILTVTIAHATFGTCFVAVLVRAQLAGFDRTLEEAALDLGARPFSVLWRVTLQGISPALVSGWLLAFTLSLDDLVVASFVSGPSATTLPMAVYSSVRIGVTPEINALATVFLGVVMALVTAAFLLIARQERRRGTLRCAGFSPCVCSSSAPRLRPRPSTQAGWPR
jgi:putrescine transport system permease protein